MEIIITAANANYFELVQGTVLSIREKPQGRNAIVGFFDLGCTPEQLQWLQERVNIIKQPDWEFNFPSINEAPTHLKGLLARPFLRKYFPNFDIYLWIDADAWIQDWKAVDLFIQGAKRRGLAVVPEIDRGSHIQYGSLSGYWRTTYGWYKKAFGDEEAEKFYSYPMVNAGIFALHKDAPHWEVWQESIDRAIQNFVCTMTDQIALNYSIYNCGLFAETEMLPAWCNWTCHFGLPAWDREKSCLVEPFLPHTPLGIIHLTGEKHDRLNLVSTDMDLVEGSLRYSEISLKDKQTITSSLLPVGDYVSPGFKIIQPDRCFPNMIIGDTSGCPWPYLRREIPHNWYADKRHPYIGFVSRDEAHILYNTALKFKGKKVLEIGCWMGWSACHLALAGVELDVIDPILEKPEFYESVSNSLQAAGVLDSVRLIPGYSPEKVEEIATEFQRKWSLIFIDGNHDAPGPLNDAIICETLAEADALILFHDLASPDVAQGLDYLKQRGWNTMIYQTMQIMGVAWRGNVEPVIHQPDPKIEWHLPEHLQHHPVSGTNKPQIGKQDFSLERLIKLVDKVESEVRQLNITEEVDVKQAIEFNQQGREFFIQGDFNRALVAFKNAGKLNPSSGIANKYLSQLYWQTGDFAASLKHYLLAKSGHGVLSDREIDEFQNLLAAIRPFTLLSEARLFSLYTLARQICIDDIPGNFVECGTCKGGSAALLAFAIKRYSLRPRMLYAFDTFEGMPDPTDVDKHNGIPANDTGLGVGTLKAPIIEGLDVVCQALDVRDIVVPVQGLFASTLPESKSKIADIALLHADGDWYESTMDIFNNLFAQVVDDGVIQIDDYGFWEGCRKAIHEFERSQNMSFPLVRIDETGVWFRKADATVSECDLWRTIWYLAEAAEKIGDTVLAEKVARATLKLLPGLVAGEAMLARLQKIPELNLRAINLIIFPDWTQPEELLLQELESIIRVLLTHPERSRITLLVETSNISKDSADLAISDVVMKILYEEELDVDESPEISFVSHQVMEQNQWEALRSLIHTRIIMNNENRMAITASGLAAVPSCDIASFRER
ncbi:class I SAM-dependent methyltransferase [Microseira wollei]|uniref:Macrocin-O-methyltransferase domain protein n=1 Tax=Microseira wollei NIES-4236 TaxID=2530354 RepID=A0AAV3XJK5_9CYAN|nr:TylF/MycF/NovP-related O-methyltransferase [Microseira wollei]GET42080.1 macrocin-O-methyltransferase domain protein [Microseira wollei NIES-4236]